LNYQAEYCAWFAANQALFNRVASFYFEVIQAHEKVLDLSNKEALTVLEKLTHTTETHPHPVMPFARLEEYSQRMFRRAAINAALGSARSFSSNLGKWRSEKRRCSQRKKFIGVLQCLHVHGTSRPRSIQVCGKSGLVPPS